MLIVTRRRRNCYLHPNRRYSQRQINRGFHIQAKKWRSRLFLNSNMSSESESKSFKGMVEALVKRKVLSSLQMTMASEYMLTHTAEQFNYLRIDGI
jgi:hypothetical protein